MLRTLTLSVAAAALLGGQAFAQAGSPPTPTPSAQPMPSATASTPAQTDTATPDTAMSSSTMPAGSAAATQPAEQPTAGTAMQTPSAQAATSGQTFTGDQSGGTIMAALQGNPQFSMLVTALTTTNLNATLSGTDRQYTLFAPTNAALEAIPEARRTALMSNPPALQALLLHHVVGSAVTAAQLRNERDNHRPLPMAAGGGEALSGTGDTVMIGGATVTQADVRASNGVIHVIDGVIMPAAGATPAATTPAAPAAATPAATPQG